MHDEQEDFQQTRALIVPSNTSLPARTVVLRDELQIVRIIGEELPSTARVDYDSRVWSGHHGELNERASDYVGRDVYGDAVITGDRMGNQTNVSLDVIEEFDAIHLAFPRDDDYRVVEEIEHETYGRDEGFEL